METFTLVILLSATFGSPAAITVADSPGPVHLTYWDEGKTTDSREFVVVLDPGHDPPEPGAISCTGLEEVQYNDALVRRIGTLLRDHVGISTYISRRVDETLSLVDRAARISGLKPDLVVSIHHDSVKPQFIRFEPRDGIEVPVCADFRGYSLFAQAKGRHQKRSQKFARAVARAYRGMGMRHTTYHAMKIPGENRRWIDSRLGIHAGDYLFLLRRIDHPVVLIESGFLVHPDDERQLRDPDHCFFLARAIADAIVAQASATKR